MTDPTLQARARLLLEALDMGMQIDGPNLLATLRGVLAEVASFALVGVCACPSGWGHPIHAAPCPFARSEYVTRVTDSTEPVVGR